MKSGDTVLTLSTEKPKKEAVIPKEYQQFWHISKEAVTGLLKKVNWENKEIKTVAMMRGRDSTYNIRKATRNKGRAVEQNKNPEKNSLL